jgi:DNA-binding NarL/FixJ family response regulator
MFFDASLDCQPIAACILSIVLLLCADSGGQSFGNLRVTPAERPDSVKKRDGGSKPGTTSLTASASPGHVFHAQAIARLTARENEILDAMAQGLQDKMIAASLSISEETVGSHAKKIFRKLGVRNRTQAALVYRGGRTASEVN